MNPASPIDTSIIPRRRIRHVRQAEASECGLAALTMIANWWGNDIDLGVLRRRFGVSSRGIGMRSLMQTADTMGFAPRPLKLPVEGLASLQLPAILHWDMNHFVVVERVSKGRAYIVDPGQDGRWHDHESLSGHFTGVALELRPTTNFHPTVERRRLRLSQLWSGSNGMWRSLTQAALLSAVLQAHVLVSPYFLQIAVDRVLPALDVDLLGVLALGFGMFALIGGLATLMRSFVLLASGTGLSFGISSNVARHLMRLPVDWFERRSVGEILSRFQSVMPIQRLLTEKAAAALIDGLLAVLTLVLMFVYSPRLAIIPLCALATYAVARMVTLPAERRAENERIAASGREQSAMIETLRGIVTLRLAGRETMRHSLWQNRLSESLGATYAHERIRACMTTLGTSLGYLEIVLVVWIGIGITIGGGFSIGMLLAFLAYRLQFATATRSLVDGAIDFRMLSLHLDRLSDIALTIQDRGFDENDVAHDDFRGEIEVRNVRFQYGIHDPQVLKGVSMRIRPGEHVAITGSSGGGKTTLSKILLGLLDPTDGEVLIDGLPLARYGRRSYREHVGAVLQDDVLFAGTIADNVAGFDVVEQARLDEAMKAASIFEDVMAMPMKQMTLVGDMGSTLSGGQRQRVLLARALYRRPKVLIMDEGTAHLDVVLERAVNEAISTMGITRIVIAHRRETIDAADRVITLSGGVVVD